MQVASIDMLGYNLVHFPCHQFSGNVLSKHRVVVDKTDLSQVLVLSILKSFCVKQDFLEKYCRYDVVWILFKNITCYYMNSLSSQFQNQQRVIAKPNKDQSHVAACLRNDYIENEFRSATGFCHLGSTLLQSFAERQKNRK